MDHGCNGCTQKIIEKNAQVIKNNEEAQELANETGEWVGIYVDEYGYERYAIGSTQNIFFKSYVTPNVRKS